MTTNKDSEITIDGVKLPAQFPTSIILLAKLAAIAIHADEMSSPSGQAFDHAALRSLLDDPEVKSWVNSMSAYLPVKR